MKTLLLIVIVAVLTIMLGGKAYAAGISDELFAAVEKNDIQKVQELIANGADVDVQEVHGNTPLFKAATYGYTAIAELLIVKGADVNAQNRTQGNTPLILAASFGHIDIIKRLLEKGADVNAMTKGGQTPLMAAAYSGFTDIAKLLIAKGADVNRKDARGDTALAKAERRRMTEMVNVLKQAGAQ